jgi:protein farnesyltransferase/geranylgeranyltransferase type-1 subunit alpha
MDKLAVKHLKPYQTWHRRRLAPITRNLPGPELGFVEASLKVDVKTYHTWSYQRWLLAYFNDEDLWGGELDFVDVMLVQDVRNNSAWHHPFFIVFQPGVRQGEEDRARVIRGE